MSGNLTDGQKQALALDKNISVTAGAGSGKTKILTDRFLKIALKNPHRVRNVLAITFTNKAAGEMMDRIASEVNNRLNESVMEQDKLKLHQIRDQLNSTYISTIHTFCSKILREFPIEAGIQPDFKIIEDIRSIVYKAQAVKYGFDYLNSLNSDDIFYNDWINLFTALDHSKIKNMLDTAISNPFEMEKIVVLYNDFNYDTYRQFIEKEWLKQAEKCANATETDKIADIASKILTLDNQPDKNEKGQNTLNKIQTFIKAYKESPYSVHMYNPLFELVDTFTKKSDGTAYTNLGQLGSKNSWSVVAADQLILLSGECEIIAARIERRKPGNLLPDADREWFRIFKTFIHLYHKTDEKFREIKNEQNVLDYEDLQIITIHLLQNNEDVFQKILKRFDYIMVDEFQDTNPLQWEIIKLLVKDQDGKLFVVGDPKQSIYGFRNADIRIFNEAKNNFAKSYSNPDKYSGNVVFRDSFRFLPRLNNFINYIFENTLQENDDNPYEVSYHSLNPKRELPGKGWVELALIDVENNDYSEEEYIAYRIDRLMNEKSTCFIFDGNSEQEPEIKYGNIAILLRSRTHLIKLEEALRKKHIPFKTVGGIGFWQRQEIYDIYYLLRFLSNPVDDLALIGVLRSKLFMIADSALFFLADEEGGTYAQKLNSGLLSDNYSVEDKKSLERANSLIQKWLLLRERINLAGLLKIILNDTHLKTVLSSGLNGGQIAANVDKLLDLADMFDAGGLGGLHDFLANINELIDREIKEGEAAVDVEDDKTVKIMTIHSSKGLQFPVVFVPYLNPSKKGLPVSVYIDPLLGMATSMKSSDMSDKKMEHTLLHLLRSLRRQKEYAEDKRLFYVATTRASNYIFLTAAYGSNKINRDTPLEWISNQINIEKPTDNNFQDFTIDIVSNYPLDEYKDNFTKRGNPIIKQLQKKIDNSQGDENNIPHHLIPIQLPQPVQTFSATRIMVYLQDKDEYYRRYHLGFFENDYNSFAKEVYQSDHHLLKGKIVHKYLELKEGFLENDDVLIEKILLEFDVFDIDLMQRITSDIQRMYQNVLQSTIGQKIFKAKEYRNEVVISTHIGNDNFTGALDRIIFNEQGLWEVVDYKTNKIKEEDLNKEAIKYEWQIKSYALLISRLFPQQKIYPISFYFLEIDRLYHVEFSKEEIIDIEKRFIEIIKEIKTTFPLYSA